jgi:hypothetical protein
VSKKLYELKMELALIKSKQIDKSSILNLDSLTYVKVAGAFLVLGGGIYIFWSLTDSFLDFTGIILYEVSA